MCPPALNPSSGTSKALVDNERSSEVDTCGQTNREPADTNCNRIPGSAVRSVVHATLSPSSASDHVSPKRNHNRPSCSKDEPRSVPTNPNRVSVQL